MPEWASATEHKRYSERVAFRRHKCRCGCGFRATHIGKANGIALTRPGCELSIQRWVRDGATKPVRREVNRD